MTDWETIEVGEPINYNGRKGILLTKPTYKHGSSWGCHCATIQWEDGTIEAERQLWNNGLQTQREYDDWYNTKHESIEVSTPRGSHWVLYGEDLQDYKDRKIVIEYGIQYKFKDKRSYYYDSSD